MKVGEYVRYKYENCIYIGKIKFISEVMGFEETLQLDIDTCMEEILKENIIKSSPNIIDLIEVGDYVNGYKVWEVKKEIKGFGVIVFDDTSIHEYNIKQILTKEQMEANKYVVERYK